MLTKKNFLFFQFKLLNKNHFTSQSYTILLVYRFCMRFIMICLRVLYKQNIKRKKEKKIVSLLLSFWTFYLFGCLLTISHWMGLLNAVFWFVFMFHSHRHRSSLFKREWNKHIARAFPMNNRTSLYSVLFWISFWTVRYILISCVNLYSIFFLFRLFYNFCAVVVVLFIL